jgi:hypothetical protein
MIGAPPVDQADAERRLTVHATLGAFPKADIPGSAEGNAMLWRAVHALERIPRDEWVALCRAAEAEDRATTVASAPPPVVE